ncbi:MAG: hypothetical protein AB7H77_11845 [Bdellovibrionales bacterium]
MLALILTWALPAMADIDHRCLNQCINQGKPASACMPECTYNEMKNAKRLKSAGPYGGAPDYNVLEPVRPYEGLLVPGKNAKSARTEKDYVCMKECLQNNGQYQRCSQTCKKQDCLSNNAGCSSLGGTSEKTTAPRNNNSGAPSPVAPRAYN